MSFREGLAGVLAGAFGVLAGLHVGWALARRPAGALVPEGVDGAPLFRPGPGLTLLVACALAAAAGVALGRGGVLAARRLPWLDPAGWTWLFGAGAWTLGAVLAARVVGDFRYVGLFKRVRGTRFARLDTRIYTPLCALLAAGVLYLAAR